MCITVKLSGHGKLNILRVRFTVGMFNLGILWIISNIQAEKEM